MHFLYTIHKNSFVKMREFSVTDNLRYRTVKVHSVIVINIAFVYLSIHEKFFKYHMIEEIFP